MTLRRRELLVTSAISLWAVNATAQDSAFKLRPGPYAVKTADALSVTVGTRDVPLRVTVPDAAGAFPLIVFSHGALSSKDLYTRVIEHWASHGYAAIQPTHVDSESLGYKFGSVSPGDVMSSRIAETRYILDNADTIAAKAGFMGAVDLDRIAVSGHSFGGWIALIMAGLPLATPNGPQSFGHPRVKALVAYNGTGPMPQVANDRWTDVRVPVFAASGTSDPGATGQGPINPWRWRIAAYDLAGSKEKYAVSITMGDHYYGGLICREGAGGKPDPDGLAYVNGASTAFLDAYLKNDAAAKTFLRTADLRPLTNDRAFLERI